MAVDEVPRGSSRGLAAWLRACGVSDVRIGKLLLRSGCTTPEELRLFLRLQLPPLQFASAASVQVRPRCCYAGRPACGHTSRCSDKV